MQTTNKQHKPTFKFQPLPIDAHIYPYFLNLFHPFSTIQWPYNASNNTKPLTHSTSVDLDTELFPCPVEMLWTSVGPTSAAGSAYCRLSLALAQQLPAKFKHALNIERLRMWIELIGSNWHLYICIQVLSSCFQVISTYIKLSACCICWNPWGLINLSQCGKAQDKWHELLRARAWSTKRASTSANRDRVWVPSDFHSLRAGSFGSSKADINGIGLSAAPLRRWCWRSRRPLPCRKIQ